MMAPTLAAQMTISLLTYAKGKLCTTANSGSAPYVGSGTTHTTEFDIYSRPITATSAIDGKSYVRSTLYNANGQVSFVGYPALEFTQPYPDTLNGRSLRYTYQNGYMASAKRGEVDENFMTVVARYADGALARSTNVLTKTDRDYDFLGRLARCRWKH